MTPSQRDWLLDESSLTDRLRRASGGDFRVELLRQCWARPRPDESRRLAVDPAQRALVREVLLVCGGVPWVYARSVLPATSLTGPLYFLRRFGARSLGAELFRFPGLRRDGFELTRCAATHDTGPLWGRRSVFILDDRRLLVSEFFLPTFRP